MTDLNLPPPVTATPPTPAPGRGVRIALAVSLALNLGVAGLIGGLWLEGGPGGHGDMVRDLGFGPFDAALRPEDRDALRKRLQDHAGDLKAAGQEMRGDAAAILLALRATPFDKALLTGALLSQEQHLETRLKLGNQVIGDFLVALPDQERTEFADRYEHHLRRPKNEDVAPGN